MKKLLKYGAIAMVVFVFGIQLVPVDRTNPSVVSDLMAPLEVKAILQRSCYDCHSNETEWPWYSYLAPVSWLVAHDVEEGREELNFSEWGRHADDADILEEIVEEIEAGEMPMPIYLLTHSDATVSAEELAVLRQWAGVAGGGHHQSHDDDD